MPAADPATDQPKTSFKEQFFSLGTIYWLSGWMELIERFAYYGVRVISPLFFVAALEEGGLELSQIQKGQIWAVWAIVQSFVPILSGGFADRYGFKINIAASTVFKILGYFVMGYTIVIAEKLAGMPIAEARAQGVDHTYGVFFAGAMLLAFGTAIFKPGLQGLIAATIPRNAASLGWGLFYQMVNIGAFFGPMVAAWLRTRNMEGGVMHWENVFLVCSAVIALNFIPLFMFKEPARPAAAAGSLPGPLRMLFDSVRGLLEPRIFFYTIAFCGFWLMNQQFFDILPNFIDDWVDSRAAASALMNVFGENAVPTVHGGNLTQEWMLNLNALIISIFAFAAGYVTGRFGALTNIITGIAFAIIAIFCLMASMSGWWVLVCIAIYSIGEMTAAPSNFRYLTRIAPEGKKGLYMGYSNFTVGIGWSIGSIMAGYLYHNNGDKAELARRHLIDHLGMDAQQAMALSKGEVLPMLQDQLGLDAIATRQMLWDTYDPYSMWLVFGSIGVASMIALIIYNRCVTAADANPGHTLNTKGDAWVKGFLIPINLALLISGVLYVSLGLALNALFFWMMLAIGFNQKGRRPPWIGMSGFLTGIIALVLMPMVSMKGGTFRLLDAFQGLNPDSAGLSAWIFAGLAGVVGICAVVFPKATGLVTGAAGLGLLLLGYLILGNHPDMKLNAFALFLLVGLLALLAEGLILIFKGRAPRSAAGP
jgi:proton-dependent oligopeptide transporter, POT family